MLTRLIKLSFFLLCVFVSTRCPALCQSSTLPQPNSENKQKCVVAGRVADILTGEPIKKASVQIRLVHQNAKGAPANTTGGSPDRYLSGSDAEGRFRFDNLEPGEYSLSGEKAGFVNTAYGAKGPQQTGTDITLQPSDQVTDTELKLIPQGIISGKVIDGDGDPVSDALVVPIAPRWSHRKLSYVTRGGVSTNDRGEYRLTHLESGRYYVCVQPRSAAIPSSEGPASSDKPDVRLVYACFPDTPNMENAAPIDVQAGQEATGMDVRLRPSPTYHVRGKIIGDIGSPARTFSLNVMPRNWDVMNFSPQTNVKDNYTFDLAGIAPGAYSLNLLKLEGTGRAVAHMAIEVDNKDLNNLVIDVLLPGTIRGQVKVTGGPQASVSHIDLSRTRIVLTATEGSSLGNVPQARVKENGSFVIEDVLANKYYARIMDGPQNTYLRSVRLNDQEVLGDELDLAQNTSGQMELVFQYGAGEADGVVDTQKAGVDIETSPKASSATVPNTLIALVPDVITPDGSGIRSTGTDQHGAFSLTQIPPGHYRAFAFQQMNVSILQNPNFLQQIQSEGVEVDLHENEQKQLKLPLISTEEAQRVAAASGGVQ